LPGNVVDFYFVVLAVILVLHFGRRHDHAFERDVLQLEQQKVGADVPLELFHRQPLLLEVLSVGGPVQIAGSKHLRRQHRPNGVRDIFIGNAEAHALGLERHGALGDHLVDELRHVVRDHLWRDSAAANQVLHQRLNLAYGHLLAPDLCDHQFVARGGAPVSGNHRHHHRQRDDAQQHAKQIPDRFVAAAKQIKH
jgi:hypothetical protein